MKIAFFGTEGWEESTVRARLSAHDLSFFPAEASAMDLPPPSDAEVISVFTGSRVDQAVLERFPNVKLVTTRSTGYDHIDRAACAARGITVCFVPGYGNNTVAEFAFGLLLNLTRKIYQAIDRIKEAEDFSFTGLRGMDLKGKTIGIVGTGRIGREMAKIAAGFGMTIIAYDPHPDAEWAATAGVTYLPLEELLAAADAVSIHCPYTKETHHLINKKNIGLMKRGAYLVNTARGGIVETEALVGALKSGALAGAGLDVLEEEGEERDEFSFLMKTHPKDEDLRVALENHILMKMPNVLVTPHNAFNTQEALERILETTLGNIEAFAAGKPQNVVPPA